MSNLLLGEILILLTEVMGYTCVQAWFSADLTPPRALSQHKKSSPDARRIIAGIPLIITQAMRVVGLTIEEVTAMIRDMLHAVKYVWNNEKRTWEKPTFPTGLRAAAR